MADTLIHLPVFTQTTILLCKHCLWRWRPGPRLATIVNPGRYRPTVFSLPDELKGQRLAYLLPAWWAKMWKEASFCLDVSLPPLSSFFPLVLNRGRGRDSWTALPSSHKLSSPHHLQHSNKREICCFHSPSTETTPFIGQQHLNCPWLYSFLASSANDDWVLAGLSIREGERRIKGLIFLCSPKLAAKKEKAAAAELKTQDCWIHCIHLQKYLFVWRILFVRVSGHYCLKFSWTFQFWDIFSVATIFKDGRSFFTFL